MLTLMLSLLIAITHTFAQRRDLITGFMHLHDCRVDTA